MPAHVAKICNMAKVTKIHQGKEPFRRHFIEEWAALRNLTRADVARELGVDKSQTTRWFQGQLPQRHWQERIAALFEIAPEALLRHPDEDWLARMFEGRRADERERMKQAIELTWPPKSVSSKAS